MRPLVRKKNRKPEELGSRLGSNFTSYLFLDPESSLKTNSVIYSLEIKIQLPSIHYRTL